MLKNALDQAYREWSRKAAAYLGYGWGGAARAIEHLRLISVALQMAPTRTGVDIQRADVMSVWRGGAPLEEIAHPKPNVEQMLDELAWWTKALAAAREKA